MRKQILRGVGCHFINVTELREMALTALYPPRLGRFSLCVCCTTPAYRSSSVKPMLGWEAMALGIPHPPSRITWLSSSLTSPFLIYPVCRILFSCSRETIPDAWTWLFCSMCLGSYSDYLFKSISLPTIQGFNWWLMVHNKINKCLLYIIELLSGVLAKLTSSRKSLDIDL